MNLKSNLHPTRPLFWIYLVMLAGAAFRTTAYFGATSMWLDEVASALNIQPRNFYQLATEKLHFNQVAPLGFLWTSKLSALLFGENDLAYRFVPWVWSLFSLPLFYAVAKRFVTAWYLFAAVALFSLSYAGFLYAFQAKQYSGDLAIVLLLTWLGLRMGEGKITVVEKWLMSIGAFVGLLSCFQAVPIAAFIAMLTGYKLFKENRLAELKTVTAMLVAGLIASLITVWFALNYNTGVRSEMTEYWQRGFPSGNVFEYLLWFPTKLYKELAFFIGWYMYDLMLAVRITTLALLILSIPGIVYLKRKNGWQVTILFSTIIIALLLAITHQYPFTERISFYASFVWIISGMAGLQALATWIPVKAVKYSTATMAVLFGIVASLHMLLVPLLRPPYYAQPMQPVLKELKKKIQPGDVVYVYPKARWALQFYGPKEGLINYQVQKSDGTLNSLLRDADKLRGKKRVWFIFTQWTPSQPYPDSIKSYMGKVIGKEIDRIADPYGLTGEQEAAAHLYDLSGKK